MIDYSDIIRKKIELIIHGDLTMGRTDNDLEPFTDDQIKQFIENNNDNIETVIEILMRYVNDNGFDELDDPSLYRIREYLYDYVNT